MTALKEYSGLICDEKDVQADKDMIKGILKD